MKNLIRKYNVPVPRYTSYPAVPYWQGQPLDSERWMEQVNKTFQLTNSHKGISLYLHLPFCESLCTYCGCNKRITKNHGVEIPYIESLISEWQTYLRNFNSTPKIRELHLGGGTPTFFKPENLRRLINNILGPSEIHPKHSFSFEGSPANTSTEHLRVLCDLGFRRLSLGVQDFDHKVQKAINRIESFQQVEQVVEAARTTGYQSINLDLVYGLPFQTATSITKTLNMVGELRPDRIAFYSYAHVPWKSPSQRGYSEKDLPRDSEKRQLYDIGRSMLSEMGYTDIGMDHFALETDTIFHAYKQGKMHRNFMGYTENYTDLLIGLGASAISDTNTAYAQNHKTVEVYQQSVEQNGLAVFRGHFLSDKDQAANSIIKQLICNSRVSLDQYKLALSSDAMDMLRSMEQEGLINKEDHVLTVTSKGKPFIRNICSVFDHYYTKPTAKEEVFSKAI